MEYGKSWHSPTSNQKAGMDTLSYITSLLWCYTVYLAFCLVFVQAASWYGSNISFYQIQLTCLVLRKPLLSVASLHNALAAGTLMIVSCPTNAIWSTHDTVSLDSPLRKCLAHMDTLTRLVDAGPVSAKWTVQENKGGLLRTQHCLPGGLPPFLHLSHEAVCLLQMQLQHHAMRTGIHRNTEEE